MSDVGIYADLLADGFKDDPAVIIQLKGIPDGFKLLQLQSKGQIEAFSKLGCVKTYGDGEGVLIGYSTKDVPRDKLIQCSYESAIYVLEYATQEELMLIQQNASKVEKITKEDWYKKYLGDVDVYILQMMVVREDLRGSGVFGKLISSVLKKYQQENMPVVLQTHNIDNVAKYEHYGFELMETIYSEELNLKCFNMLKK